jgi:hypothetical protein
MKKLIAVSILLTILSAAVFAQLTASLNTDFYPELLKAVAPLDDNADKDKGGNGGKGTFDFFSSGGTWKTNEIRFSLRYADKDGNYSGYLRVRGDGLFTPNADPNVGGGKLGTTAGPNKAGGLNFVDILGLAIDEYEIWGKLGNFSGKVSSVADRGKVNAARWTYHNFMDGVKVDNYGILSPKLSNNKYETSDVDVNNLRRAAGIPNADTAYMALSADFKPFTVTAAGDFIPYSSGNDTQDAYSKIGAAFRVSGDKIADMITFDVTYKVKGGDPDTIDEGSNVEPDGKGHWNHAFGLYAYITAIDKLGLGVGYSGFVKIDEEVKDTMKYTNPFYSGIDLRARYTGIDKLTVTTAHNFTFTGAKGDDDAKTTIAGIMSSNNLGNKQEETYFAMYNSLGVDYKITDALTGSLAIANRMFSDVLKNDSEKITTTYDKLRVAAFAQYAFNSHVNLASGLAFQIEHTTLKDTANSDKDSKAGYFTFGIPIRFQVVY